MESGRIHPQDVEELGSYLKNVCEAFQKKDWTKVKDASKDFDDTKDAIDSIKPDQFMLMSSMHLGELVYLSRRLLQKMKSNQKKHGVAKENRSTSAYMNKKVAIKKRYALNFNDWEAVSNRPKASPALPVAPT